jgi:hypothetical protein
MSQDLPRAHEPAVASKRITATLTREIKATPQTILPLLCPVEELRWIPAWDFDLIYAQSGRNETDCVFNEALSGPHFFDRPLTTTWVTTIHDPDNGKILFHIFLSGKAVLRLDWQCRETARGVSRCTWQLVFTAIDAEANAMADDTIRSKLDSIMTFLAEALKHYCETGRMLG